MENKNEKLQYEELETQRETTSAQQYQDSGSNYMNAEISWFGKLVIASMAITFILSLSFLIYSYTSYGRDTLRSLKIDF
ncbi:hypothetical protein [Halobacteriovorax sp. HLS]|uniref:hypothetical protein n=1 Tax=Halobacteriovorax sp. HLS TaxID=2234000 RepID=UPI000FD9E35E|nr:hypothetical protein [Halobacteriovorax sp. HLS]